MNMKRFLAASLALSLLVAAGATAVNAQVEPTASASVAQEEEPSIKSVSLGIGSNEQQRTITWLSLSATPGKVQLAHKSDVPGGDFSGVWSGKEYDAVSTPVPGTNYYSNKATVDVLTYDEDYLYRVGNDGEWSDVYTIETSGSTNFSFLLAGDPQIGAGSMSTDPTGWANTLDFINQNLSDASFLLSAGDQVNTYNNHTQYNGYVNNALASLTTANTIGNHDSSIGRNDNPFQSYFTLPNMDSTKGATDAGGDYWFTYNGVLFMDLNSNNQSTAEHKAFMEEAIAANPDAKWKIVVFHHSVYSVASHAFDGDILARRDQLVPVFSELGIDAVLMGHDHVYTRSYMMNGTTPDVQRNEDGSALSSVTNPSGTLYLTANSASGSKFYTMKDSEFPFAAVQNQERVPNITKIEMTDTSMRMITYRVNDGSIVDDFTINKTQDVMPEATANTTITAEASIEPSYSISIPATIDLGKLQKTAGSTVVSTPFQIEVKDFVKGTESGHVDVTVAPADAARTFQLNNGSSNLSYNLLDPQDQALTVGGLFASFDNAGVQNGKITVDASTISSAGDYQGTVIFTSAYGE
jgi:hypothetical protein